MRKTVSLTVALALALASQARSGAHLALDCQDLDPAVDGDADRAFLCLADYQQRLEALEADIAKLIDANSGTPFVAAGHSHAVPTVPSGAVLAFDLPNGCPDGWAPFAAAQSRAIVGATDGPFEPGLGRDSEQEPLRELKYREHGGAETVTLKEAEMPRHSHLVPIALGPRAPYGRDSESVNSLAGSNEVPFQPSKTDGRGSAQPHNNMPPYIALYYCKKD